MNPAWVGKWCVLPILLVGSSGCAATSMLGKTTRALENVAKSMDQTRDVLRKSEGTMGELGTSLQSLSAPMGKLSALEGPMKNLGTLVVPLENLGSLAPGIDRLGTRMQGVETNLQTLEKPLENVAALEGPLDRVRELEKPLKTIAQVGSDRTSMAIVLAMFIGGGIVATFLATYGGFVVAMRRSASSARKRGDERGNANKRTPRGG